MTKWIVLIIFVTALAIIGTLYSWAQEDIF